MIEYPRTELNDSELQLQSEVRSYLASELNAGLFNPTLGIGGEPDIEFSRRLAQRGWVGMVIPPEFGGLGGTAVERFIVAEELLAVGAPISAHWVGDRQTSQMLMHFGTDDQKAYFLPKIAAAEIFIAIGLSEPNSGSDLASLTTRGERVDGGWVVNGLKSWTSGAHYADFALTLIRTSPNEGAKHAGLSQVMLDLRADGVTISPVLLLNGQHHFNEVLLDDVFVPDDLVIGEVGAGWNQVTSELAFERSGPDRFLSVFPLVQELLQRLDTTGADGQTMAQIGAIVAQTRSLREMSLTIARMADEGKVASLEAALTKDLGTMFEQQVVNVVRMIADRDPGITERSESSRFEDMLSEATVTAPTFTLRGGTNEILRMLAAKQLRAKGAWAR